MFFSSGKQRTVEEVLQEMDSIEKRNRGQINDPDVQLLSDKKKTPADSKTSRLFAFSKTSSSLYGSKKKGKEGSPSSRKI